MISKTLQAKFWYRSFSVNRSTKPNMRMMLPVMNLLIFTNQHPGLYSNITLYEVESTNQRNTLISLVGLWHGVGKFGTINQHCRGYSSAIPSFPNTLGYQQLRKRYATLLIKILKSSFPRDKYLFLKAIGIFTLASYALPIYCLANLFFLLPRKRGVDNA